MAEHLSHYGEQHQTPAEAKAVQYENLSDIEARASQSTHEHEQNIEHIRKSIEHTAAEAARTREQQAHVAHESQPVHHHYITKKIKAERYTETLKNIRQSLPKSQQVFSKIIHQPAIEQASELGAKTVARPSGIIGGAVLALIGSLAVMAIARHIGFEVPNSIFTVLFMVGFIAGLIFEMLARVLRTIRPGRHRS